MTVTLRCQNCGFSFTVTYPNSDPTEAEATPVTCGHCRSNRWAAHSTYTQ